MSEEQTSNSKADSPSGWFWVLYGSACGAAQSFLEAWNVPHPIALGITFLFAQLLFLLFPVALRQVFSSLGKWARNSVLYAVSFTLFMYLWIWLRQVFDSVQ